MTNHSSRLPAHTVSITHFITSFLSLFFEAASKIKASKIFLYLFFTLCLSGCFSNDSNDGVYTEFKNIKTDQFIWEYGRGGIYWVSDNEVVLDAITKNTDGVPERGVYQVNLLDGSFIKIAGIGFKELYKYCFDGNYLYLESRTGDFKISNYSENFEIVKVKQKKKEKGYKYSETRCSSFKKISGYANYALSREDGYLLAKNNADRDTYRDVIHEDSGVELVTPSGNRTPINLKSGVVFRPQYLIDRDMYFGYKQRSQCSYFWWLKRGSWEGKTEKKCFGAWAQSSSLIFIPTRVGLFIEHHTTKGTKTYLSTDMQLHPLEDVAARGSSLAPDGCRIAYGSGNYRGRKNEKDYRQVLKIFNACEFLNNQPQTDAKVIIPDHINRHS